MNKICQMLGISTPIIHEPIHTLTNGNLVTAISEAGALGILGINSGYKPASDTTSGASATDFGQIRSVNNYSILDAMQERNLMNEQIDKVLSNTFRPFGVEIASNKIDPNSDHTAKELVELMRKRRITIALFEGFGNIASKEWITLFHQNGIKVMQVINKINDVQKGINNGIDILISKNQADLENYVKEAGPVPVLAGEDTTKPQVLSTVLAKGAQGVFLKTVFATAKEAPTSQAIKKAIVEKNGSDLVSFKMGVSTIFSLPGNLPNQLAELSEDGTNPLKIFTVAHGFQGLINGMLKGDLNMGYTDIADDIDYIYSIESAEKIIHRINNK